MRRQHGVKKRKQKKKEVNLFEASESGVGGKER